jgi:hypothetical protein
VISCLSRTLLARILKPPFLSTDTKTLLESLLNEMILLTLQYDEALKKDEPLSVKKEIRLKLKDVQGQIEKLKDQPAAN